MNALTLAALGTGFTFLMTAAGAAVVFLFKNEIKPSFQLVFLGFAAGVMIAASVWSLPLRWPGNRAYRDGCLRPEASHWAHCS